MSVAETKPRRSTAGKRQRRSDDEREDEDEESEVEEDEEDGEFEEDASPLAVAVAEAEANELQELFCVCRRPYDGRFMVCCDGCSGWFHPQCVGTTKRDVTKLPSFYCPSCLEKSGVAAPKVASTTAPAPVKKRRSSGGAEGGVDGAMAAAAGSNGSSGSSEAEVRQHLLSSLAECLGNTEAARSIATAVESALFKATESTAQLKLYKTRGRSILYNLRDASNQHLRDRVLAGSITPQQLAEAMPDTLASPQVASARRASGQRALEKAVITDDMSAPEYVREKRIMARVSADETDAATTAASASTTTTTTTPTTTASRVPSIASLISPTNVSSPTTQPLPSVPAWTGMLDKSTEKPMPGVSITSFGATGWLVSGRPELAEMIPASLEIAGRMDISKLFEYLHQLAQSASRRRCVLRLDTSGTDAASVNSFASMHEYFMQRSRAGFVKSKQPQQDGTLTPEELYIVPLKSSVGELPVFLEEDTSVNRAALSTQLNMPDVVAGRLPRLLLIAVAKITTIDTFVAQKVATIPPPPPPSSTTTTDVKTEPIASSIPQTPALTLVELTKSAPQSAPSEPTEPKQKTDAPTPTNQLPH